MTWKGARWTESLLVLAIFSMLFFVARAPLFSMGWDGQDGSGHDADIFVHQPVKPNYFLFARLNGKEIYVPVYGHPAPDYAMYSLMGSTVQHVIDYDRMSNSQIIAMLKTIASLFQLAIWFPLLALIMRNCPGRSARVIGYFGLTALALSPMAIQSTNEFQIDSMFGFVTAGAYALGLLALDRSLLPRSLAAAALAAAAAMVGLGKNEWGLVLAIACFGVVVFAGIANHLGYLDEKRRYRLALCLFPTLAGLILGNLASYLFEPDLYMSGWKLLAGMVTSASIASGAGRVHFVELTLQRITFIQVHLLLLLFMASRIVANRSEISPALVLASLFGAGLFAAFFISTWAAYPRYFAPAFAALCVVGVWLYIDRPTNSVATIIGGLACCWLAVAGIRYARNADLARSSVYGIRDVTALAGTGCARLLPVEDAYRRKDIDFVHMGWGYAGAVEAAQEFGGHVCPPN